MGIIRKSGLLLALTFLVAIEIHAQQGFELKRNAFKFSPQHFITNTFAISYERFNAEFRESNVFWIGVKSKDNFSEAEQAVIAEYQHRFYIPSFRANQPAKGKTPGATGVYFSPFLQAGYYSVDDKERNRLPNGSTRVDIFNTRVKSVNPGIILGVQATAFELLYFDFYVGGGIRYVEVTQSGNFSGRIRTHDGDILEPAYKGMLPKAGISVGVGF